jgi:hypothetical protein
VRAAGDAEVVAVDVEAGELAVVAGDFAVAGDGEVFAAGDFTDAGEVEVFGELCAKARLAGRAARRAIARSGLIGFMETEPFLLLRLKKLVPDMGPCQGERHRSDAPRQLCWNGGYFVRFRSVNH